jgi:hypothetical protein
MARKLIIGLTIVVMASLTAWFLFARQQPMENTSRIDIAEARLPKPSVDAEPATQPIAYSSPTAAEESAPPRDTQTTREAQAITGLDARTLTMCHRAVREKIGMEQFTCAHVHEKDVTGRDLCRKQLKHVRRQLQQATAGAASCPETLAEPSVYYQALRDLASGGDIHAQRCFIQGYFGIDRERGIYITQAQLDEYVDLTKKFIDAAFERGDWSVVRWLSKPRVDMADFLLARAHPMGLDDRVAAYKIRRLLMLGNQPAYGTLPQDDPKRLVEYWRKEKWLTPEQLEEAESWAQTMYQKHFIGSQEGAAILPAEFCAAS